MRAVAVRQKMRVGSSSVQRTACPTGGISFTPAQTRIYKEFDLRSSTTSFLVGGNSEKPKQPSRTDRLLPIANYSLPVACPSNAEGATSPRRSVYRPNPKNKSSQAPEGRHRAAERQERRTRANKLDLPGLRICRLCRSYGDCNLLWTGCYRKVDPPEL